jgi:hypothetical protein
MTDFLNLCKCTIKLIAAAVQKKSSVLLWCKRGALCCKRGALCSSDANEELCAAVAKMYRKAHCFSGAKKEALCCCSANLQ